MTEFDYDLFVIGAGSGGVRAARVAAAKGYRIAVAEDRYLGGTCVNVGCVPKKLFAYGAHFHEDFNDARGFGWDMEKISFDWPTLRDNKTTEIHRLNEIYRNLLSNSGAHLIESRAVITGPHTVKVDGQEYSCERILIATGGWPTVPDFPGNELAITSNEVFYLDEFPSKIVLVGGGYIAIEFAGIFAGLGAETHLIYRGDLFLRGFDQDVRTFVKQEVEKNGIHLHFNCEIDSLEKSEDGTINANFNDGSTFTSDQVVYATGRHPATKNLGLEEVGVDLSPKSAIVVDDYFQTSIPSIYALGDVIDRIQLTPVALAEAMILIDNLYGERSQRKVDYDLIPTAVFCQPNIASVGLTEAEARDQYGQVEIYRSEFRTLKHTLTDNTSRTMMKLIVDSESDKIVGAHMVGAEAADMMQGIAIALRAGATKKVFDTTIGIHPTSAEEWVTMREPV